MESHLQQNRRIEAITNLASGIAHQFNNALVGITGSIELLQMNLPSHEKVDRHIGIMKDSVHKMVQLTNQLLAYAQGGKFRPETISLTEFVEDKIPLIRHTVSPSVHLETDLKRWLSLKKVPCASDADQHGLLIYPGLDLSQGAPKEKRCA